MCNDVGARVCAPFVIIRAGKPRPYFYAPRAWLFLEKRYWIKEIVTKMTPKTIPWAQA